jgi:SAM-dependent methyltransferase
MTRINLPSSYQFDHNRNIWIRPDYKGIAYSEGSAAEQHLKAIIDNADDVSVMSSALASQCTDWATLYHLSRKRSNILRPLEKKLKHQSILEIGSGCGAITRYLGETQANVLALEGSPSRATIGAARCRDLENVTVVSDNFQTFATEEKFDVITLIGVLEYARSFVSGDNPTQLMLSKAKQLLKPGGMLIIAIENKLGLKYFAGYPEDHTGKPMFGIEDHYQKDGVVTFGKKELATQLHMAGFPALEWWYPFPDYKTPGLLVSDKGIQAPDDFDLATLIRGTCFSDGQTPENVSFIQERGWKGIIENGLAADLSNSFLLVASADKAKDENDIYALHYASNRRPEFAKQVMFAKGEGNRTFSQQSLLYPEHRNTADKTTLIHQLDDIPYTLGISWQDELTHILSTPDWQVEDIKRWWDTWLSCLSTYASQQQLDVNAEAMIDGRLLDAMPRNLIYRSHDDFTFIDLEWLSPEPIDMNFFLFRALFSSFQSIGMVAPPAKNTPISIADLSRQIFALNHLWIEENDLQQWIEKEQVIQIEAAGTSGLDFETFKQLTLRVADTLTPDTAKTERLRRLKQCEEDKQNIYQSTSWKITKPLRSLVSLIRK